MPDHRVPDVALPPCGRGCGKKKATMAEITPRPGQEPERRPGPWPQRQDIPYCENTGCLIRRRQRPAVVTLAGIWSGALTLSCDECARRQYNHFPGSYRVLPLSEYRDWYAEARSQMQDGVTVVTTEIIDEACARAAAPSPAPSCRRPRRSPPGAPPRLGSGSRRPAAGQQPWCACRRSWQEDEPAAARTLLGAGIAVTACVAFGVFPITWGNHLASQEGTYSNAPEFLGRRLGPDAVVGRDRLGSHRDREVLGSAAPPVREWKASLTPQQRAAADLAEAAAMTGAAIAMRRHTSAPIPG